VRPPLQLQAGQSKQTTNQPTTDLHAAAATNDRNQPPLNSHPTPPPPTGAAQAATYVSVTDAVKRLPELSTLNANLDKTTLAQELASTSFIGTVFLPTNDALANMADKVRGRVVGLALGEGRDSVRLTA